MPGYGGTGGVSRQQGQQQASENASENASPMPMVFDLSEYGGSEFG